MSVSLKSIISFTVGLFLLGGIGNQILTQAQQAPTDIIIEANSSGDTRTTPSGDTRFTCQVVNGVYTVMYHPISQPNQAYAWAIPSRLGGGWSSHKRCYTISERLETYRLDGLLELGVGKENGMNILCVTTQQDPSCRIVLTVPEGEDPILIRDRVFNNLIQADSGQGTSPISTSFPQDPNNPINVRDILGSPNPQPINLRPFLDTADGGTGTQINR